MFWFCQVFGLILMLLKSLSYLFKAFGQSGEMDFFSSQVHHFVFILFDIILSIYKKSECLEVIVFLVCSTCTISQATLFFFFKCESYSSFATLLLVCSICNALQNNKIFTQQIGTIFSQFLRC